MILVKNWKFSHGLLLDKTGFNIMFGDLERREAFLVNKIPFLHNRAISIFVFFWVKNLKSFQSLFLDKAGQELMFRDLILTRGALIFTIKYYFCLVAGTFFIVCFRLKKALKEP